MTPAQTAAAIKRFPVLSRNRNGWGEDKSVPWEILEPHRAQAMTNHGQTLERLAERGGLSPEELLAIVLDKPFYAIWGWG